MVTDHRWALLAAAVAIGLRLRTRVQVPPRTFLCSQQAKRSVSATAFHARGERKRGRGREREKEEDGDALRAPRRTPRRTSGSCRACLRVSNGCHRARAQPRQAGRVDCWVGGWLEVRRARGRRGMRAGLAAQEVRRGGGLQRPFFACTKQHRRRDMQSVYLPSRPHHAVASLGTGPHVDAQTCGGQDRWLTLAVAITR